MSWRWVHSMVFVMCVKLLHSQDVHFSQYYFSPLTLNPANTGNYKGDYRFFGNYRSQWRELNNAYETYSAGGDFNFYPDNRQLSAGFLVLNDRSGGNLNVTKIMPSAAMHTRLAGFKIGLGLQPSLVLKRLNFNAHTFQNQLNWSTGAFDNKLPNNENTGTQSFAYFDLNAGCIVSRRFKKLEPEIGYSFFHINQPGESFLNNDRNKLPIRQATNLSLSIFAGSNCIIKLHSLYGFTTRVNDWVNGFNVEYILANKQFYTNSVFVGAMWRSGYQRNQDAGIVTAGINYRNYTLGFSYDITFSQLKTAVNSRGAYELAFIYKGKSTRLTQKILPCERY